MPSQVVRSVDFQSALDAGLAPEQFSRRFLVEGDSWMDRSDIVQPSLPESLVAEYDQQGGGSVLLISVARFGDTIENMGRVQSGEFGLWLQTPFNAWRFDGVLLSGGGNDLIDAARDPAPGTGILKDLRGLPAPTGAAQCINEPAFDALVSTRMDTGFASLYNAVQASQYADVPIFLNCYDFATPRNAPASPGSQSWLWTAFVKNGIPPALWQDLADLIFFQLQMAIANWTRDRPNVHVVPTTGTLTPAAAGSTGSSNDWLNEIHPNQQGWRKLAKVWHQTVTAVVG